MYAVKAPELFDAKPELGMGYHFGVPRDNPDEGVIVLNAQFALTPDDILDPRSFDRLLLTLGKEVAFGVVVTIISAPPLIPERSIVPCDDISLFKVSFGHLIANVRTYEARSKLHASPPFSLINEISRKFRALLSLSKRS